MKSIAGNTGVLMPTTASRISTAADAGVLVDTLANGWDDLLELLKAAGASLAGLITTIPAAPSLGLAIPASIVVVLLSPPIKAGESDEDIAEWKKQQEESKKEQEEGHGEEGTNSDSTKEKNKRLDEKTPDEIADMNRDELKENLPDKWKYEEHNGRVHIKDENGQYRIRIDPGDSNTPYRYIHIYDENGNLLDINGNPVNTKDPAGHIPYSD